MVETLMSVEQCCVEKRHIPAVGHRGAAEQRLRSNGGETLVAMYLDGLVELVCVHLRKQRRGGRGAKDVCLLPTPPPAPTLEKEPRSP